jgi:purine-binding chemotaxis protein CheW
MTENETTTLAGNVVGGKFLTFALADEEYGLPILTVREIVGMLDITAVPQTPPFMRGVVNLRGKVIPIIDLRIRFGFPEREYDSENCIIVVEVADLLIGIIVDAVREVLSIPSSSIEPPPAFGRGVSTEYILGLGKAKDRIIILLKIESVLSIDELQGLRETAESL